MKYAPLVEWWGGGRYIGSPEPSGRWNKIKEWSDFYTSRWRRQDLEKDYNILAYKWKRGAFQTIKMITLIKKESSFEIIFKSWYSDEKENVKNTSPLGSNNKNKGKQRKR